MPEGELPAPPLSDPLAFLLSDTGLTRVDGGTTSRREPERSAGVAAGPPSLSAAIGASAVRAGASRRAAGLVWLVLYWGVSGALLIVAGGILLNVGGFLGGVSSGMADAFHPREAPPGMMMEVVAVLGLLLFHLGILTELACHGLWTFRSWGLSLAKILAVVYVIGSLIGLVWALVMLAGVIASLAGLVINGGILIYLFGNFNLSERFS
jgi:hypothetical protein